VDSAAADSVAVDSDAADSAVDAVWDSAPVLPQPETASIVPAMMIAAIFFFMMDVPP
jgi:hypothetical protein